MVRTNDIQKATRTTGRRDGHISLTGPHRGPPDSSLGDKTKLSKSRSTSCFLIILQSSTLCLTFLLVTHLGSYQDPPKQTFPMHVSIVSYRKTIFEHPKLTKIIGVLTYETLHLLHSKINPNGIAVHSNIGGDQHSYLGLVFSPTACALLSNTHFVSPVHTGTLVIPIVATHQTQDKLKRQQDKNLRIFHEMGGL